MQGARRRFGWWFVSAVCALQVSRAAAAEPVIFQAGPDWDVTLTGRLRPRFVAHSGRDFLGDTSEWREFVTQRARLGVMAEEVSGLTFLLELQDVRIWGEEEDGTVDFSAAGLDAHQALARIPILNELSVSIGRQEFVLDEERLVGNLDWTQRGRAFDGVRLAWTPTGGRTAIDALYAKVQEPGQNGDGSTPEGVLGDTDFGGVHASMEYLAGHELAPLYIVNARQGSDDIRHTAGIYMSGSAQRASYRLEGYYQFGSLGDATVNAYLGAAQLGYALDIATTPYVLAWAEVLSGNGSAQGTFDAPYGTNHDYYGEMDFFLSIPEDTRNLGLVDLGGQLGAELIDGLEVLFDAHYFRTAEATRSGSSLGLELEPKIVYQITDYIAVRALYGIFVAGDAMRAVRAYRSDQPLSSEHLAYVTTDVAF